MSTHSNFSLWNSENHLLQDLWLGLAFSILQFEYKIKVKDLTLCLLILLGIETEVYIEYFY